MKSMSKRRYKYGYFNSDETDLGRGANTMYRLVMYEDDVIEERKRIREVIKRLANAREARFVRNLVLKRLSLSQTARRFRIEEWEAEEWLKEIIAKIESFGLEPVCRPVKCPYAFNPSTTLMRKQILSA